VKETMKKATLIFTVLTVIVIALYDVFALATGGYEATISCLIYTYSKQQPIIPFVFGVFAGHLFFPNKEARGEHK
jgi:zinc transporter ZupT